MSLKSFFGNKQNTSEQNNENNFGRNVKDINGIKNHTALVIESVHIITFGLYYIGEAFLDNNFFKIFPKGMWGEVFKVAFAVVGYTLMFFVVKGFHSLFLKLSNSKYNLKKHWYHVHIPIELNGRIDFSRKSLSAGTTNIFRSFNDFTFVGDNFDYNYENGELIRDDTRHTEWQTETSEICDSNDYDIIEVYKAYTNTDETLYIDSCPVCKEKYNKTREIQRNNRHRYGIHRYHILRSDNGKINRIECDYTDCWPSLKSGRLYLYDNQKDWERKIQWYFNEQHRQQNIKSSKV